MSKTSQTEMIIRRLYQVTSDYQKGFDIQLLQLLMLGLEQFNLDIGIFSKIRNNKYEIIQCIAPEGVELSSGDCFDFEATYCEVTCRSHTPVAVDFAGESELYARHPAYREMQLESYIGVPIYLNNELYGTLNFSSAQRHSEPFRQNDIDLIRLMASWIESELVRHKQEKELTRLNEKLAYQANYDALTKIPNRRYLFETMNQQIEVLRSKGAEGSIVVIDLDYFKMINDTYGHQRGDEILVEAARLLKECIGEGDFVARFGGEEFVVWLPDSTQQYRSKVLSQLAKAVNHILLDGQPLTLSCGVCHFSLNSPQLPGGKEIIDKLLSSADKALYEAKSSGRDRVVSCHEQFLSEDNRAIKVAS